MQGIIAANLLGVEASEFGYTGNGLRSNQGTAGKTSFVGAVKTASYAAVAKIQPSAIVSRVAVDLAGLLGQISNSTDLAQRRALALSFREKVIQALQQAGYSAGGAGSPDKIVVEGRTYDIISSLNTPGTRVSAQWLLVTGGTTNNTTGATRSVADVVFTTGKQQSALIQQISSAVTMEERLGLATQFRDKVIDALKAAGHSAQDLGKPDKISVNGVPYDILRAVNALGMNTAVQLLPIVELMGGSAPGGGSIPTGDPRAAILAAGAAHGGLFSQISSSSNLEERRAIGTQLQALVVEALSGAGYTAEATDSPDKIIVNGQMYDFIRSLNSPGTQSALQTLLVV